MILDIVATLGGLLLLIFGADFLVRGAVGLSRRFGISPLVIGLTVIALGTSLPELVVTARAAYADAVGLAVGNIVGSNIANILLILGVGALLSPIACSRSALMRDGAAMLGAMALFVVVSFAGTLGVWHGLAALVLLAAYLYGSYRSDKSSVATFTQEAEEMTPIRGPLAVDIAAVVGGLVGVIGGAELLVTGAIGLARDFGVSEEVIGLTLVAIGTSLPELATTVAAGLRKHAEVALGNALGSNLFNTLGIMGVVTILQPIDVPEKFLRFDFWVMMAAGVLLLIFLRSGWRLGRPEAATFLVLYVAFIAAQVFGVGEMLMAMG
jgi:cation:H+ antiporter